MKWEDHPLTSSRWKLRSQSERGTLRLKKMLGHVPELDKAIGNIGE